MAVTIRWKVPTSISSSSSAHSINVYRSIGGENGDYSLLASLSAGGGNSVSTYTDSGGSTSYFYFVRYVPSGGSEGDRVLAVLEPGVTEQRIAEQIKTKLPEIIVARLDSNLIDIRKAMQNALDAVNAYSPPTSYTFTNLPGRLEVGVVVLGMALLYMEHQLQVSIRDYSYGGTGINLAVDRNSKFSATIQNLVKSINDLLLFLKHKDWPIEPLGLGSEALATPSQRIFSFIFNAST